MGGVRTLKERRRLIQYLGIEKDFWIGAVNSASEGNWYWLNGEPANSSELIWAVGEPDGGTRQNCVAVIGDPQSINVKRTYENPCDNYHYRYPGVFEEES